MNFLSKPIPDVGFYAFWDVDKSKLDFNHDKDFIVSRMFERGKFNDVLKIIYYYGIPETKSILKTNKYLSTEGVYFAHTLLDIPLEDFASYAVHQHD
jgi:hypothetical protein